MRPRNRCWLRAQFNGSTYDLFKGYVESYDQQHPAPGQSDAVCVVQASDELKMLNLRKTRAMDPPDAADYVGVVGADNPSHVWRWRDEFLTTTTIVDEGVVPRRGGDEAGWEWCCDEIAYAQQRRSPSKARAGALPAPATDSLRTPRSWVTRRARRQGGRGYVRLSGSRLRRHG